MHPIALTQQEVSVPSPAFSVLDQRGPLNDGRRWYAVYTRSRHEKRLRQQLEGEAVECFLPLHEVVHRWKDRRALVSLPLFPGYLFVRIVLADRMHILTKPGVINLVGTHGHPSPIPDREIDALRLCSARRVRMEPHSYLPVGERVRVWNGPFAEMEGILLRRKGNCRLVLSIDLIARSVAVEVDWNDVVLATERAALS